MAKTLSQLKKNRKASFEGLQKEVEKAQKGGNSGPKEGYWFPGKKDNGEMFSIIRFLPMDKDADLGHGPETADFARIVRHKFKGPKGFYDEVSLSTLGKEDAIARFQNHLWNNIGTEAAKTQYRAQKRVEKYVANIMVISDSVNADNNGKVFLYEMPPTIFKMLEARICPPPEAQEDGQDVFCVVDGSDFKLQATPKKGSDGKEFPDYSISSFKNPAPLAGGDVDKIEAILAKTVSIQQFINPDNKAVFKSPEDLQKRLEEVMGKTMDELLDDNYTPQVVKKRGDKDSLDKMEEQETGNLRSMLDDEDDDIPKSFPSSKKTEEATPEKKAGKKKAPAVTEEDDEEDVPPAKKGATKPAKSEEEDDLLDDLQDLADLEDI